MECRIFEKYLKENECSDGATPVEMRNTSLNAKIVKSITGLFWL